MSEISPSSGEPLREMAIIVEYMRGPNPRYILNKILQSGSSIDAAHFSGMGFRLDLRILRNFHILEYSKVGGKPRYHLVDSPQTTIALEAIALVRSGQLAPRIKLPTGIIEEENEALNTRILRQVFGPDAYKNS